MTEILDILNDDEIIAQLRRDGNYDLVSDTLDEYRDHSTTKTGWKL